MKSSTVKTMLVCAAVVLAAGAAEAFVRAAGSDRLLAVIRQIRPGSTKREVRELMGREPNVLPAGQVPSWIEACVPHKQSGEFWYFFMGFPPRNLIIYFDENEQVAYTTWAPT